MPCAAVVYGVAVTVSEQHREEVQKILKYLKNMEGIIRTSPNPDQKARVQKELAKQRARLAQIVPGLDATRMNSDQIMAELQMSAAPGGAEGASPAGRSGGGGRGAGHRVLDKISIDRASANSTDPDVNFLASVFTAIQKEYWPAISEQHCELDFSHSAERDAVRSQLENVFRNMKVLLETIEEYAGAEHQDFREQLLKMKNRQTRAFIFDANDMLRKIREFMEPLMADIEANGGLITNKSAQLRFNSRFEEATMLEGRTVSDAIQEFNQLVREAIQHLNLPSLKKDGPGH